MPRFQPGVSGNPRGRPKGSLGGRARALQVLDQLLAESESLDALRDAWRQELARDPLGFWRRYCVPLLPRGARLELVGEEAFDPTCLVIHEVIDDTGAEEEPPPLPPCYRRTT